LQQKLFVVGAGTMGHSLPKRIPGQAPLRWFYNALYYTAEVLVAGGKKIVADLDAFFKGLNFNSSNQTT
jgi:hypothetical protein